MTKPETLLLRVAQEGGQALLKALERNKRLKEVKVSFNAISQKYWDRNWSDPRDALAKRSGQAADFVPCWALDRQIFCRRTLGHPQNGESEWGGQVMLHLRNCTTSRKYMIWGSLRLYFFNDSFTKNTIFSNSFLQMFPGWFDISPTLTSGRLGHQLRRLTWCGGTLCQGSLRMG